MQGTLQKEMDEDESLYDKLACWCNNNRYEKDAAITAATAKLKELKSTIDASTAKSAELVEKIKETEAEWPQQRPHWQRPQRKGKKRPRNSMPVNWRACRISML
jgi:hypothetical protein